MRRGVLRQVRGFSSPPVAIRRNFNHRMKSDTELSHFPLDFKKMGPTTPSHKRKCTIHNTDHAQTRQTGDSKTNGKDVMTTLAFAFVDALPAKAPLGRNTNVNNGPQKTSVSCDRITEKNSYVSAKSAESCCESHPYSQNGQLESLSNTWRRERACWAS